MAAERLRRVGQATSSLDVAEAQSGPPRQRRRRRPPQRAPREDRMLVLRWCRASFTERRWRPRLEAGIGMQAYQGKVSANRQLQCILEGGPISHLQPSPVAITLPSASMKTLEWLSHSPMGKYVPPELSLRLDGHIAITRSSHKRVETKRLVVAKIRANKVDRLDRKTPITDITSLANG